MNKKRKEEPILHRNMKWKWLEHLVNGCSDYKKSKANDGGTLFECTYCHEIECLHTFGPIEFEIKKPKS